MNLPMSQIEGCAFKAVAINWAHQYIECCIPVINLATKIWVLQYTRSYLSSLISSCYVLQFTRFTFVS